MSSKRLICLYLFILNTICYCQTIDEIGKNYWSAVDNENYNDQVFYGQKIIDYFEQGNYAVDSTYIDFLCRLGTAYYYVEDFENAKLMHLKSYKYCENFFGLKNPNTLFHRYALVNDYFRLKNNEEVLRLAKICLSGFDELQGEQNEFSLLMLQYLSTSYELVNKLDTAAYYSNDEVKRTIKLKGDKNEDYLYAIFKSARINKNLKNYSLASDLYQKCIDLSPLFYDNDHFTYETSLYNLADIKYLLGDFYTSIKLGEECLLIQKRKFGENHVLYANTLMVLANSYHSLGEYDYSLDYNKECYEIRKKILGEENEVTWKSLSNIALDLLSKGDWISSFKINQELVEKKKFYLTENNYSYIESLSNLSVDYSNLSKLDSSYLLSLRSLKLAVLNGFENTDLYSIITQNLAFYYLKMGSLDSSLFYINSSLNCIDKLYGKNSFSYFQSLEVLSSIYEKLGKTDDALNYLIKIHNYNAQQYGVYSFNYAKSLSNLASFYNQNGNYQMALDSIQKALSIYKKTLGENHFLTLQIMSSLALFLNNSGELYDGLEINLKVLGKRELILGTEHKDYISSLNNVAENYALMADYQNSKRIYSKAVLILENNYLNHYPDLYSTVLSNYGTILLDLNEIDSSFLYLNKSLNYTRTIFGTNSENYIIRLNNLGTYFNKLGHFALSKQYYDSAIVIANNILGLDHPVTIQCFENLASCYGSIGDYKKAIEIELICLEKISDRFGIENLEYAYGLNQLAFYNSKIGSDSLSKDYNENAYYIRKKKLGEKHPLTLLSAYNLSVDYNNLGWHKKALELLDNIIEIYRSEENNELKIKLAYNNKATIYYDLKDYEKAIEFLNLAYDESEYFADIDAILINFSSCYEKIGNLPEAIKFQSEAVQNYLKDYLENQLYLSEDQKTVFKQKLDYHVNYLISLNYQNDFLDCDFSWYNQHISSKNLIGYKIGNKNNEYTDSLNTELKKISDEIKFLKARKNKLIEINEKSNLLNLESEIDDLEVKYSSIIGDEFKKNLRYQDIQNKLHKDTSAFVEIISISSSNEKLVKYIAVIISKDKIMLTLLDPNLNWDCNFYSNYKDQATDFYKKTDLKSPYFYDSFWKPIAEKIGDAKTLFVSLGGIFNNINLNTIFNPETGKYLLEEKDIRIVNSARDFILNKESQRKNFSSKTASLYGFPNYDGNTSVSKDSLDLYASTRDLNSFWLDSLTRGGLKAKPLVETKIEIENISALLNSNGWNTQTYLEDLASETNIKKESSPRVLHVATHGYFFENIPIDNDKNQFLGMEKEIVIQDPMLRSGLLFTGANRTFQGEETQGENGLLSAAEASLLDLRETELVVLSACETGKGEIKNSEGVYGLRKAFADAGAQNIIMSLWKVDDKVTQEFMTRFYEVWLNDNTSIREAFNKTQLEIKEKYPEPYYWGAFILVGD